MVKVIDVEEEKKKTDELVKKLEEITKEEFKNNKRVRVVSFDTKETVLKARVNVFFHSGSDDIDDTYDLGATRLFPVESNDILEISAEKPYMKLYVPKFKDKAERIANKYEKIVGKDVTLEILTEK